MQLHVQTRTGKEVLRISAEACDTPRESRHPVRQLVNQSPRLGVVPAAAHPASWPRPRGASREKAQRGDVHSNHAVSTVDSEHAAVRASTHVQDRAAVGQLHNHGCLAKPTTHGACELRGGCSESWGHGHTFCVSISTCRTTPSLLDTYACRASLEKHASEHIVCMRQIIDGVRVGTCNTSTPSHTSPFVPRPRRGVGVPALPLVLVARAAFGAAISTSTSHLLLSK